MNDSTGTTDISDEAVTAALAPLVMTLESDDFRLAVARTGETAVRLTVTAGPSACAECLVPKHITQRLAEQQLTGLRRAAWEIAIEYPTD